MIGGRGFLCFVLIAITKMDILYMFYHFQDPIKVIRRYEGCHYTRLESYYIIFYFETDWSRIRPLPSTTLNKWLQTTPKGTWKDIVGALGKIKRLDVANKVEEKYINDISPNTSRIHMNTQDYDHQQSTSERSVVPECVETSDTIEEITPSANVTGSLVPVLVPVLVLYYCPNTSCMVPVALWV